MVNQNNSLEENPFTALFGSAENVELFMKNFKENHSIDLNLELENDKTPTLLEKLLLVSTRKPAENFTCVYIEDAPSLTVETIDTVLFERLLLQNVKDYVANTKSNPKIDDEKLEIVGKNEVVYYLFDVYERCWKYGSHNDAVHYLQASVVSNLMILIEQPDIIFGQNPKSQLTDLFLKHISNYVPFKNMINQILKTCNEQNQNYILQFFKEVLTKVQHEIENSTVTGINFEMIDILEFYASSSILGPLLLTIPDKKNYLGYEFTKTILGSLLSISCLPKGGNIAQKNDYFGEPSRHGMQAIKAMEKGVHVAQNHLINRIYELFMILLKVSSETKQKLLTWIKTCLESNSGRAGLWHIQGNEIQSLQYISDGFMANLGAVMLKLSLPFSRDVTSTDNCNYKVLKVDPMYLCAENRNRKKELESESYSSELPKLSTLIPQDSSKEESDLCQEPPSFMTSCFFLTHRTLHLGIQVIHQKMKKMSQDLGRLQAEYQEISESSSPAIEMLRKHMDNKTSIFLAYKAVAFEPSLVDNMMQFYASTSLWLVQVALSSDQHLSSTYKEPTVLELSSEHSESSQSALCYIPELLVENITEAIIALKRYMPEALSLCATPIMKFYISFIITFMGSPQWMYNPHLRAHLAQCLESLISKDNEVGGLISQSKARFLEEHPLSGYLVSAIVHVFVSIEMTGQSVSFEEKFNYRRPMYEIMKQIWEIPAHKKQFVSLANSALENMESANPPLFLRFVNLLINDAIFLLDEGLSYMSQIRELQSQRDERSSTSSSERDRNLQQIVFLVKFHNMLGSKTIQTLVILTEGIPSIFTHPTLVDRMASMLNYFLLHLVGPKQRNLKVRDMEKYEFRPAEIVFDICSIYINLNKSESFAAAVCADDRSYSPELFDKACGVLHRIGRYALKEELELFGAEVNEAQRKKTKDEDFMSTAPDEFIDPITLQLMTDPVLLPSSKIIVDRQTIARHLLSDQTDPFNRQPLTMEDVIGESELKDKIAMWKEEKRRIFHTSDS